MRVRASRLAVQRRVSGARRRTHSRWRGDAAGPGPPAAMRACAAQQTALLPGAPDCHAVGQKGMRFVYLFDVTPILGVDLLRRHGGATGSPADGAAKR